VPNPAPDAAAPTIGAVVVPATSQSRDIDVRITATDDVGVTQIRLATEDGNWGAWQAFAPTTRFTLKAGLGLHGVYVQVRDAAGRESNIVYKLTTVTGNAPNPNPLPAPAPAPEPDPDPAPAPAPDPQPGPDIAVPTLRNVTIPATSAASAIDVRIDAVDDHAVTQMRLATDDGNWGAWQPFQATARFNLRAGIGFRGVYVQVRDAAGHESGSLYRTIRVG
jgi:hypothetical protein